MRYRGDFLRTIYKAEDLTTNPDSLAALIAEISGGQIGTNREWLDKCLGLTKVHACKTRSLGFNRLAG